MELVKLFGDIKSQVTGGINNVNPGGGTTTDLNTMIKSVLNWIFGIIGIVAVVMIIIGGFNMMISAGDPGKVKKGKDTILYGIIGLVISILAFAIVNFVIGGIFK
jgi:type IV secretory pathway VirB2 component (pilin)